MLNLTEIEFIKSNINSDINKLALIKSKFHADIRSEIVLHQIKILNKISDKLPLWSNNYNIFFPKNVSIELASSEATAKYKKSITACKDKVDLFIEFGNGIVLKGLNKKITNITIINVSDMKTLNAVEGELND